MKNKYRDISRRKTPWDSFTTLSPLETFIKNKYVDTYNYKHPLLKDSGESDLLNSFIIEECKYCHSKNFKKKGYTRNGVQRYYCLECHRSFTILTNTIFENHKISITEWIEFCLDLFYYDSISVTSKTNKNGYNTSKYWLHKLFLVLDGVQEQIVLQGNVQIDETFYPVSKSDKILKDGKELRGLSRNQYCIGIGFDGTQVYARVEEFGKTSQKKTLDTFRDHITIGSKIIHDKEKSHKVLIKKYGFVECVYNANEIKKLGKLDNPLEDINQKCNLLKMFLNAHSGFDRDDLQNYLNLFCFIQNPPYDRLEKVEKIITSAIYITKSLKYRDLFSKK